MYLLSWEIMIECDPQVSFGGELWSKKRIPNGPFLTAKSLVYVLGPAQTIACVRVYPSVCGIAHVTGKAPSWDKGLVDTQCVCPALLNSLGRRERKGKPDTLLGGMGVTKASHIKASHPHFPRFEGLSAFSAFSPYRVRLANFENPTDRLYCDRPWVTGREGYPPDPLSGRGASPDTLAIPKHTWGKQRSGKPQNEEPKTHINIKNLGRTPPPTPPPQAPLTLQILYAWGLFSLQNTGKGLHEEFRGGVLGAPKFFTLNFFACFFFLHLKKWASSISHLM